MIRQYHGCKIASEAGNTAKESDGWYHLLTDPVTGETSEHDTLAIAIHHAKEIAARITESQRQQFLP